MVTKGVLQDEKYDDTTVELDDVDDELFAGLDSTEDL
jgi:hypothetical protein